MKIAAVWLNIILIASLSFAVWESGVGADADNWWNLGISFLAPAVSIFALAPSTSGSQPTP